MFGITKMKLSRGWACIENIFHIYRFNSNYPTGKTNQIQPYFIIEVKVHICAPYKKHNFGNKYKFTLGHEI